MKGTDRNVVRLPYVGALRAIPASGRGHGHSKAEHIPETRAHAAEQRVRPSQMAMRSREILHDDGLLDRSRLVKRV